MKRKRARIQVMEGRGKTFLSYQMLPIRKMCRLSYLFALAGQGAQTLMAAAVYDNMLAAEYCLEYESFIRNFLIETNTIIGRSI